MTQDPFDPPTPGVSRTEAIRAGDAHAPEVVQSLKLAMRRARSDEAERSGALADLRVARISRLELMHEALRPLIAQIPADIDLFDVGLMPGANPRLFIDMIGYVEMGRDARLYRFVQDTRHGRTQLAESVEIPTMVEAITDYVARRLLERDKALAADAPVVLRQAAAARGASTIAAPELAAPPRRGPLRLLGIAFAFLIDLLGSIAFFTILAGIGWIVWSRMHGQTG